MIYLIKIGIFINDIVNVIITIIIMILLNVIIIITINLLLFLKSFKHLNILLTEV
jgi:hypothetical protein